MKRLDELKQALQGLEEKILINNTEYENLDTDIIRLEEKIQSSYKAMQESNVKVEALQAKIVDTERLPDKLMLILQSMKMIFDIVMNRLRA